MNHHNSSLLHVFQHSLIIYTLSVLQLCFAKACDEFDVYLVKWKYRGVFETQSREQWQV